MTDDERTLMQDAQDQLRTYHQHELTLRTAASVQQLRDAFALPTTTDDELRQWENNRGEPQGYRIDIEYHDGSNGRYHADDLDEAWQLIAWLDRRGGFKSAWRNDEPWLGDCTRDDIP